MQQKYSAPERPVEKLTALDMNVQSVAYQQH